MEVLSCTRPYAAGQLDHIILSRSTEKRTRSLSLIRLTSKSVTILHWAISNRLDVRRGVLAQADQCPATPDVPHIRFRTLGVSLVPTGGHTADINTISLLDDLRIQYTPK